MENNVVNNKTGLLVDEPISSPGEDRLNRIQFAEHLADVLFEHEGNKCMVVAINGEWGCGKSSILNLIEGGVPPFLIPPTMRDFLLSPMVV